jgi:ATP-dependent Clp protease ATP-binding subunit ClpA
MFERFTDRARDTLVQAGRLAKEEHSPSIRRHHLLIGLIDAAGVGSQSVAAVFAEAGVDTAALRDQLLESLRASETRQDKPVDSPAFTAESKKALELSLREALSLGHNYIGREHLLLAILRDAKAPLRNVIAGAGLDYTQARDIVREQSPPSARAMRRAEGLERRITRRLGQRATPAVASVLRRAYERSEGRNTTTGDLLIGLLETPGTHFAAALGGVTLPDTASVTAQVDRLIETRTPDGTEDAVKVDPTGVVTINDPRIADAVKKLVGDNATPERIDEILRRLQG